MPLITFIRRSLLLFHTILCIYFACSFSLTSSYNSWLFFLYFLHILLFFLSTNLVDSCKQFYNLIVPLLYDFPRICMRIYLYVYFRCAELYILTYKVCVWVSYSVFVSVNVCACSHVYAWTFIFYKSEIVIGYEIIQRFCVFEVRICCIYQ